MSCLQKVLPNIEFRSFSSSVFLIDLRVKSKYFTMAVEALNICHLPVSSVLKLYKLYSLCFFFFPSQDVQISEHTKGSPVPGCLLP